MDWALAALSKYGVDQITYIGGYQIQKVIERYPTLKCRYHPRWQEEGELGALLTFEPVWDESCLVIRSSTLILPEALARLDHAGESVTVGYYSSDAGEGPLGILSIQGSQLRTAYSIAQDVVSNRPISNVDQWVEALIEKGVQVRKIDLDGLAAPTTDRPALSRTLFNSKARTLAHIRPLVQRAEVLDQVRFTFEEWVNGPEGILTSVVSRFKGSPVVVRSSAHAEDGSNESLAGHFLSVLDVPADDGNRLREAVEEVILSYRSDGRDARLGDEVFVQPQIRDLAASGVLLTRDAETGAPYFVLNIDRESGLSNTVTSGSETAFDTVYVSRRAVVSDLSPDVGTCVAVARELEELMHLDALDIEWGMDRSDRMYLFQVRPIPARASKFQLADEDLEEELECVREFLKGHMRPHPHLYGSTTLYSTMSDWNPAEMIGTTPRPLALSLYQRLIGERSWSEARAQIGYRDARPEPLIVALGGRPYVDVRASLNSLLPEGLDSEIAERWVEHGLGLLREDPRLHDKLEFEVALPCLDFDVEEQRRRLTRAGLGHGEIETLQGKLLALTDRVLCGETAPIDAQMALIAQLEPRRSRTLAMEEASPTILARQIHYLVEDCEPFGLVPFSVLARYAFIAIALLRSLRAVGIFNEEEYEEILRSIPTVASDLSGDLAAHASGEITTEVFLDCYGHLRPSSYDITSPNYAASPDLYLKRNGDVFRPPGSTDRQRAARLFEAQAGEIDRLMSTLGFTARSGQLKDFVLRAIPARERAKFEFMKNVNATLERIATLAEQLGFDRQDISLLPVDRILSGATDSATGAARTRLRREIGFNRKRWNLTCALRLPHLVRARDDVDAFQLEVWTPNFVSSRRVVAPPLELEGPAPEGGLAGRIVMMRAADPGYDWVFGHDIAGLVTQYGGVASHMAIRAAEFGLPAAIGCGELIFERLRGARLLELDCVNRKVSPLQ